MVFRLLLHPMYRIKFINSEAATYYNDTVVLKSIVPERGLKPDAFHECQMLDNIEKRQWQTFTAHPQKASVPLVREFYANAKYSADHTTVVRGKPISFDRSTINNFTVSTISTMMSILNIPRQTLRLRGSA
ncbi:hypothetical protein TIFTF001_037069 [Ficus carica]|uniref:Putative plant transposon protein domain-containing protein n=1 Tax=Ficus carica TaxID=3494 RepID=A0AA88E6F4_FICCA|nr:hypothetical protein TIFTF001_037069 [Ficus carica]